MADSQETKARSNLLRRTSHQFCQALLSPPPVKDLIREHFIAKSPKITEHGPKWCMDRLPFLSRTFSGPSGNDSCETYFEALADTLKMELSKDAFPGPEGFIVDPDAVVEGERGVVCVVGKGRFESVETGKSWDEPFIYRLSGFDEEGRIGHWEIWADPLSAWVAVGFD